MRARRPWDDAAEPMSADIEFNPQHRPDFDDGLMVWCDDCERYISNRVRHERSGCMAVAS